MNIWEIRDEIKSCVDEETGEIIDIERLVELQMAEDQKIENVACWKKNLDSEVEAIKKEIAKLTYRCSVKSHQSERLAQYLKDVLNGEKFESPKCEIRFRKNPGKVEINDMQAVVAWLEENGMGDLVTYSEPNVSKTDIGKLIKAGQQVPGCEMTYGVSMSVK